MFESKNTMNYRAHQQECAAQSAAYELMINTNLSVARAREYFLNDFPDHIEIFEEIAEECAEM